MLHFLINLAGATCGVALYHGMKSFAKRQLRQSQKAGDYSVQIQVRGSADLGELDFADRFGGPGHRTWMETETIKKTGKR